MSEPIEDLVESCFLWCIGELANQEQAALRGKAKELREHYGCGGTWYEIVEEQMGWPMAREMRGALRRGWRAQLAYWRNRVPGFTAGDGARMFKQSNPLVAPQLNEPTE
jgi:hypothetical protein